MDYHRKNIRARLKRIERLESAINTKRTALLNQRKLTGNDARRYVMLSEAFNRLCVLRPFHRVRHLPG